MKKKKKQNKIYVSPLGYAYEQPDGSWKIPCKDIDPDIKLKYEISEDKKVITITPVEPITLAYIEVDSPKQ